MPLPDENVDEDDVSFAPAPEISTDEARKRLEALRGAPLAGPSRLAVAEEKPAPAIEPAVQKSAEEPKARKKAAAQPLALSDALASGMFKPVKVRVTTNIDADVLAAFKATGKGWQTLLNKVLRANMPQ